jgi:hypothetical protein
LSSLNLKTIAATTSPSYLLISHQENFQENFQHVYYSLPLRGQESLQKYSSIILFDIATQAYCDSDITGGFSTAAWDFYGSLYGYGYPPVAMGKR